MKPRFAWNFLLYLIVALCSSTSLAKASGPPVTAGFKYASLCSSCKKVETGRFLTGSQFFEKGSTENLITTLNFQRAFRRQKPVSHCLTCNKKVGVLINPENGVSEFYNTAQQAFRIPHMFRKRFEKKHLSTALQQKLSQQQVAAFRNGNQTVRPVFHLLNPQGKVKQTVNMIKFKQNGQTRLAANIVNARGKTKSPGFSNNTYLQALHRHLQSISTL